MNRVLNPFYRHVYKWDPFFRMKINLSFIFLNDDSLSNYFSTKTFFFFSNITHSWIFVLGTIAFYEELIHIDTNIFLRNVIEEEQTHCKYLLSCMRQSIVIIYLTNCYLSSFQVKRWKELSVVIRRHFLIDFIPRSRQSNNLRSSCIENWWGPLHVCSEECNSQNGASHWSES